jgi:hypothetical protein
MRKLTVLVLSLLLFPAIASAQSAGPPPPPPDSQDVETARPPDAEPDMQPPTPPAAPPSRASDNDQVGILQQPAPASPPATAAPQQTGQWVYTNQYGWVWMPYGQQYVDEGTSGASSPYQYVYCVGVGWSWVAAPWLWGWGAYPYFGVWGPSHFSWYRGLYRAGYGWGRYRGGAPRGGGYHATSPITRGYPGRSGRSYGGAPSRARPFSSGTRVAANGARGRSGPHAGGGFHGGGGHRR